MERSDDEIPRYSLIFLRIDRVAASLVRRAFSVFPRVSERLLRSFPSFVKKKKKERRGERKRGRGEREGWMGGTCGSGKNTECGIKGRKMYDSLRGFYIPREPRIFLDTGS